VWLRTRKSDVWLRVSRKGGEEVIVDAKRVSDPERLIRDVLQETPEE